MAVSVSGFTLVILKSAIDSRYPGGWEQCKQEHGLVDAPDGESFDGELIAIWHGDRMTFDCAVSDWEAKGLRGLTGKRPNQRWHDYCCFNSFTGPQHCDWLSFDENNGTVSLVNPQNRDEDTMSNTTSKPRYLTKSRFKLAVECPTKLFYADKREEYADTSAGNDFLRMLADGGHQVGALAKMLYPEGIEIFTKNHAEALAETEKLLAQENVVLFEPAIRFGDCFIRIDILVKRGKQFELIEVKAKSYSADKPIRTGTADALPYVQDVTFQAWVLSSAFPGATVTPFLMMPNKDVAAPADGLNQVLFLKDDGEVEIRNPANLNLQEIATSLLAKINVTEHAANIMANPVAFPGGSASLPEAAQQFAQAYMQDQKISPAIGAQCASCQFQAPADGALKSGLIECWQEATGKSEVALRAGTVLDLWNFRGKGKLIEQGVHLLSQLTADDLGNIDESTSRSGLSTRLRQWMQASGEIPAEYDHGGCYFDADFIRHEMSGWRFPLHMIDFETSAMALPFFKGMRPYESVAFQFSHHVIEADGRVRHAGQYLCAEPGVFPNFDFARALQQQLSGDCGSVFMWSHHENTILSLIQRQLAELPRPADADGLSAFLVSLTKGGARAMIDLCDLAQAAFFHPRTKGSSSIKKVLPAILSASSHLRERYAQPIYATANGIPSMNDWGQEGVAWLTTDGNADPYAKLKAIAEVAIAQASMSNSTSSIIAEGGAASTAYARLQLASMPGQERQLIERALLRYCEVDTLAMVMVVEAWRSLADLDHPAKSH